MLLLCHLCDTGLDHFSVSFLSRIYMKKINDINLIIRSCILHCIVVKVPYCMPKLHNTDRTMSCTWSVTVVVRQCPYTITENDVCIIIYGHDLHGSLPTIYRGYHYQVVRSWSCARGWPLHALYTILGSQTKVVLAQCQHYSSYQQLLLLQIEM